MRDTDLQAELKAELTAALRRRDRPALRALRNVSARIANAEAQPMDSAAPAGAVELAPGLGASEVPRRALTGADVRALWLAEIDELEGAGRLHTDLGRSEDAAELRHGAEVLRELLSRADS